MGVRAKFWGLLGAVLACLGLTLVAAAWWLAPSLPDPAQSQTLHGLLWWLGLGLALALGLVWGLLDALLLRPLHHLARGLEIISHAHPGHQLELPPLHLLGEVPARVHELGERLRHHRAAAPHGGATNPERQKQRLESVLRNLDTGVIVCNPQGKIVLYNPAANRILGAPPHLGLGRSIYQLLTPAPLQHALERLYLQPRDATGEAPEFICAGHNSGVILHCQLTLFSLQNETDYSFILSFSDITRRAVCQQQYERLLNDLLKTVRRPLANLRATAEILADYPAMETRVRLNFYQIIAEESDLLSGELEATAQKRHHLGGSQWYLSEVHSEDLVACLSERLSAGHALALTHGGTPLWLHVDSYSLILLLEHLACHVHLRNHTVSVFDLELSLYHQHAYLDLVWHGPGVSAGELDQWLGEPLNCGLNLTRVQDILDIHNSSLWCQPYHRASHSCLRLPLPLAARQHETGGPPSHELPPRPEFYDFDLPSSADCLEDLAATPLSQLEFVVFDSETTGLEPDAGDEIIALGAVRVVNGRVLEGECFYHLVNPGRPIPASSARFHGITDAMVRDQPNLAGVLPGFQSFVGGAVLVGHNPAFDLKFLQPKQGGDGIRLDNPVLDVLLLSLYLHPHAADHSLDGIAKRLGVDTDQRYNALGDACVTAEILLRLLNLLAARHLETLGEALAVCERMLARRQACTGQT